jgi:hypothetical protein
MLPKRSGNFFVRKAAELSADSPVERGSCYICSLRNIADYANFADLKAFGNFIF